MIGLEGRPAVSVIIATHNVAPFIAQAIRSVLGQTMRDFEIIVSDDGSTDGTPELVRTFVDPRLRLTVFPHRGPSSTLNDSFRAARGRYLAMLDGDDVWATERLSRHVAYMDAHPDADLTFSLSRLIDESGSDLGLTSRAAAHPLGFRHLLEDNIVANGSAVLMRREAFERAGPFDTTFAACYDHDLWLRIALLRSSNIHCIPEALTFYRRRAGQITKDWRLMEGMSSQLFEKYRQVRPDEVASSEPRFRSNRGRFLAAIAYDNAAYRTGLALLWNALLAAPGCFLRNPQSYRVGAGLIAGALLPSGVLKTLQAAFTARARRGAVPFASLAVIVRAAVASIGS